MMRAVPPFSSAFAEPRAHLRHYASAALRLPACCALWSTARLPAAARRLRFASHCHQRACARRADSIARRYSLRRVAFHCLFMHRTPPALA